MRDNDTHILFLSNLMCLAENNSPMGRDIYSLTSSIQLFFRRPRGRPPSSLPLKTVVHREYFLVTCPNQASFRRLTVDSRGSGKQT
ncbi:hypothetical protein DPMN_192449 [Dreissena polymorpha]|uniref:Uncharacterized protein n=1 Tax=Dreissena polymorpha TaxID=45954 RepID=A0A9D4BE93_DREPO|nr:hypothetical protein DPMN_192449 [Dreissena polymorpha]